VRRPSPEPCGDDDRAHRCDQVRALNDDLHLDIDLTGENQDEHDRMLAAP